VTPGNIQLTHQGLHLFPSHPDAYVLITTAGKAFSNLPEFTWPDYNKIASALPTFVQTMLPIPPMPQPRQHPQSPPAMQPTQPSQAHYQQSYQQLRQVQQQQNCCPQGSPGVPHNCCPPQPTQSMPYGLPSTFANSLGAPLGSIFTPVSTFNSAQQSGFTNGSYSGGSVYR
jgi:hypothetical protein